MNKPYVVGITGCSGSGKTYLLNRLVKNFSSSEMVVLSMDNHYKPIDQQVRDENNVVNFDLPESIDQAKLEADLENLVNGNQIELTEYTFNVHDVAPKKLILKPAPIIVMEGIFTMHYEGLKNLLDLKIFVDASEETMLNRRIERDGRERGYHDRSVKYRFEHHVLPSYRSFVQPYRAEADILVNNETDFEKDLEHITRLLRKQLA